MTTEELEKMLKEMDEDYLWNILIKNINFIEILKNFKYYFIK
jgi:hypothetical protein